MVSLVVVIVGCCDLLFLFSRNLVLRGLEPLTGLGKTGCASLTHSRFQGHPRPSPKIRQDARSLARRDKTFGRSNFVDGFGNEVESSQRKDSNQKHFIGSRYIAKNLRRFYLSRPGNATVKFVYAAGFYEGLVAERADLPYLIQLREPNAHCRWWVRHRSAW